MKKKELVYYNNQIKIRRPQCHCFSHFELNRNQEKQIIILFRRCDGNMSAMERVSEREGESIF